MENTAQNILQECLNIMKDRQEQYGDPKRNFEEISEVLDGVFHMELDPEDIIKVMIATKVSRDHHLEKDDNILDLINYLAIYLEFRRRREEEGIWHEES